MSIENSPAEAFLPVWFIAVDDSLWSDGSSSAFLLCYECNRYILFVNIQNTFGACRHT